MTDSKRVVIIGGHGKVALLAAPKLKDAGYEVYSIVRNPDHADDVEAVGANPVVLDIESADTATLAGAFAGADAVVFSAGAGGGNPARTNAVDYEAAVRSMDAAAQAGVTRYVIVSYASVGDDLDRLDPSDSFYPYAKAKHGADAYLRKSGLDYTILGPGMLTLEPSTGKVVIADEHANIDGRKPAAGETDTPRELVADVITHVVANNAAIDQTVNFYQGETPIAEAIR
ncbi:SDR family oxidoreductase [Gulosibacter molinativorax]|uniref:SDR family NAD(P)-dependent oxidoreductase n=1 Tax=Gulosibacter molinativorax TaxID=256821 RepID=A0ABT7C5N5_9MICO|nr:SDR family oxidoreductase [Gulosibacter molinativorax]MDJ1370517.1 SDR family NAD(P)-dependent oxidoreductase [Gulosibacter molinativorax]QUY62072.1 Putative sugar epimerase YhfK [Gulosibacter molinativorax]